MQADARLPAVEGEKESGGINPRREKNEIQRYEEVLLKLNNCAREENEEGLRERSGPRKDVQGKPNTTTIRVGLSIDRSIDIFHITCLFITCLAIKTRPGRDLPQYAQTTARVIWCHQAHNLIKNEVEMLRRYISSTNRQKHRPTHPYQPTLSSLF